MSKDAPSIDLWLKEAKAHESAPKIGMYLTHNGTVRQTAKAKVRYGEADTREVTGMIFSYDEEKSVSTFSELCTLDGLAAGRALAIMNDDRLSGVYHNTVSNYFPLGELLYESMLRDISRAEHYVFLEYFILEDGKMWQGLMAELSLRSLSGGDC